MRLSETRSNRGRRTLAAVAGLGVAAATLAACGSDSGGSGDEGGSAGGESWILGTTDKVTTLDPAGAYDLGSWTLMYNTYQTLLTIPAGENEPQGDAAESCEYSDPQTFTCTLQEGLTFANGNELTSSDVKFSLERNINIADPNGASGLLASLTDDDGTLAEDAIETPSDTEITFNLTKPDTTFQFILTTNASAIVDEDVFPADELVDNSDAVGSGPFKIDQYQDGQQAVLTASGEYSGPKEPQSERVFIQYFQQPAQLKQAVEGGEVDVAWRSLSPTDLNDLEGTDAVDVVEGEGSEIRYWVWQLGTQTGKKQAVRQAAAALIDRQSIVENAYAGTVDPLYSLVPPGFPGQTDAFAEKYGEEPDPGMAEQILNDAGIQTPVQITLGYTPSHYGPNAVDEASEYARQLEDSGLFEVETKSAEWTQYQDLYKENAYDVFQLGWFPDYLDADNYLSPFLVDGGFYANNYSDEQVNELVSEEQAASEAAKREEIFGELQTIVAEDVPVVPSWVGKNVAVANPEMQGVEETLDPSFIFRLWTVSKG